MPEPRIYVLCPDYNVPSGGIRKLYRHVDVLNKHGYSAAILHERTGFRCNWFANTTKVSYTANTPITAADYLVVPEVYGSRIAALAPGTRKVIFNQNAYLTFRGFSLESHEATTPYTHPDTVAVLAVSEDNREYLSHAFPQVRVLRLHYGIDPHLFAYQPLKKKCIGFMPRKNADDAIQVINILKVRGALKGFDLAPIDGRSEQEVAGILRDCLFFLSFGHPEGFSLPPAEAMACGCIVIGYHGQGGREYFTTDLGYPTEVGDILTFARTVERAILSHETAPHALQEMAARAASFIREHYTIEREERDIVESWRNIGLAKHVPAGA